MGLSTLPVQENRSLMIVRMLDKRRVPRTGRASLILSNHSTRTKVGIYEHFLFMVLFLVKSCAILNNEKSITLLPQILISHRKMLDFIMLKVGITLLLAI
jgi:hypothetical protein